MKGVADQPRKLTLSKKCLVCSNDMGDEMICAVCSTRRPCLSDRPAPASGGARIVCGREASIANGADGPAFVLPKKEANPTDDLGEAVVATVMWRGPGISPLAQPRSASHEKAKKHTPGPCPGAPCGTRSRLSPSPSPPFVPHREEEVDNAPRGMMIDTEDVPRPPTQLLSLSPARAASLSRPPTGISSPRPSPSYVTSPGHSGASSNSLGGGICTTPGASPVGFACRAGRPQGRMSTPSFADPAAADADFVRTAGLSLGSISDFR